MEVYSYLDLGMALRLHRVNRFVRNDNPEESIDREQRATFVYHADTFQHNQRAGRLACFSCLKLRDKGEFSEVRFSRVQHTTAAGWLWRSPPAYFAL